MKKIIILLLMLIPLLCGCTSVTTNLTINKDKTASIENTLVYNGNVDDENDLMALTIKDNYKKFIDSHYLIDKVFEKGESVITAKKHVKNLYYTDLEFTSLGFTTNLPDKRFISVKKNFFVTSYNIDMTYNLPEVKTKVNLIRSLKDYQKLKSNLKPEYLQKYGEKQEHIEDNFAREDIRNNLDSSTYLLAKEDKQKEKKAEQPINKNVKYDLEDLNTTFMITLPSYASYNNADNVVGTVYCWKIRKDSPTNIKLQYVVYSEFSVILLILMGVVILSFIAWIILRHDALKGVNRKNE